MVSAMGADVEAPDDIGDPVFVAYLRAKGHADDVIRDRDALDVTVVRPGHLTNDKGTGRVELSDQTGHGDIPARTSPGFCWRCSTLPRPPGARWS